MALSSFVSKIPARLRSAEGSPRELDPDRDGSVSHLPPPKALASRVAAAANRVLRRAGALRFLALAAIAFVGPPRHAWAQG